ncbi:MAG: general secretion pathway protein GspD [Nitrospira sp.]|nr:MAG: general secretion pathway protein GspD [Nitrospira sp.]
MTLLNRATLWTRLLLGCVLLVGWLVGCGAQQLFREGVSDIEAGRWDAGLAKIEEAVRKDPGSSFLRAELRQKREYVIHHRLRDADAARAASKFPEARLLYQRVLDLDGANSQARTGLESTKNAELNQGLIRTAKDLIGDHDPKEAQAQLARILSIDPNNLEAKQMLGRLSAHTAPPAPVKPKLRLKDDHIALLEFREAPLSMVFEALSRTSGINFVLDKDVKGDAKTSIFVKDLQVESALDLVLAQHALEKKFLSDNTLLIYPETLEKRRRYEDQIVKSFHLTNADPKQAMNLVKVMLDTKVLFVDDHAKLLVMRDTPEVVHMAEKLLASLDLGDSEVMMEVEVVEIQRTKLQELGIKYPTQVSLSALGPAAAGATGSASMLLKDIFTINSQRTVVSPLGVTIDLRQEDSEANILASPRIRARNYEKAKILIGDRVPVITNAVTPTSVGSSVVTGSVQYIDVGLKFEVEPTIYWNDDVAMKVNLEVSNIVREILNSQSGTLAYQIGTRSASTVLRLRDGETQVLAGLISDEDREAASKVPGLSSIPILGRLFSSQKNDGRKTEIVLSITPHIIRHGARPDASTSEFWFGTESTRGVPMTIKAGDDDRKSLTQSKETSASAGLPPTAPALGAESGAGHEGAGHPAAPLPAAAAGGAKAAGDPPEGPSRETPTQAAGPESARVP